MANVRDWIPLKASGAIGARLLVALENDAGNFSGTKGEALQADGDDAAVIGVSGSRAVKDGETVEVAAPGYVAQVVYGGAVARGDMLTSDANRKAVKTTTAGKRIVGIAMIDGVANDIGEVLLSPGSV